MQRQRPQNNPSEGRIAAASLAGLTVMGLAGWIAYKYKIPAIAIGGLVAGVAAMGVSLESAAVRA